MIIKLSILIILILGAFAFLGIKLSSSLKDLKFLFLVLYGVSIFTVCNIILSIYFFVSLRNKRGSPGPKGKTGPMGDKGIDGDCGSEGDCLKKSLVAIIIDTLEDNLQTKYKEEDANYKAADTDAAAATAKTIRDFYIPLQGFEKNAICSYVNGINWNDANVSNIKTNLNTSASSDSLKEKIKNAVSISTEDDRKKKADTNFLTKTGTGLLQSIHTDLVLTPPDVDFSKISFETCSN